MTHNFYPGPSTLHPFFEEAVKSAISSGILSENHRSSAFASLYQDCLQTIQEKWEIPKDFQLLFVSSATETWEIIAQSLVVDEPSLHLFNGAFGQKSFETTNKITQKAVSSEFSVQEKLDVTKIDRFPFIHLCQTETSNGTSISNNTLKEIRDKHPETIISIDATSSLGGCYLDFSTADIWYSSVQKCLGLPSGMGIVLINKKAIEVVKKKNIATHYNDFLSLVTNARKWQTTHTPNILAIHALAYSQKNTANIQLIDKRTTKRKTDFIRLVKNAQTLSIETSSSTVLTILHPQPEKLIALALENNIILGKGYGKWKDSTFRVALFPSISDSSFDILITFLNKNLN